MKYCRNCGAELSEGAAFCPSCGMKVKDVKDDNKEDTQANEKKSTSVAVDIASDIVGEKTKKIINTVSEKVEQRKENVHNEVQKEIKQAQVKKKSSKKNKLKKSYLSESELWSWLKNGAKRQTFYTEGGCKLSEEEFVELVNKKMEDNNVPAIIEKREIKWDRADVVKTDYFFKTISNFVNPLSCMLQFNHVGNFTFVETKYFITPPNLPRVPMEELPMDFSAKDQSKLLVWGCVVAFLSLFEFSLSVKIALIQLVIGVGMATLGYFGSNRIKEITKHNEECKKQRYAWNRAWNNWNDSIFVHSFQEDVNGQISRIFDAAFECVKQVNKEIFDVEVPVDEEKVTMNEMAAQIKNNKEEYR